MTERAKNYSHFAEPGDLHMARLAHIVIPGAPHHMTQRGNRRANSIVSPEFHPADKVTTTPHLHIYDARGNPLDANLNRAPRTSPDVHIPTGGY